MLLAGIVMLLTYSEVLIDLEEMKVSQKRFILGRFIDQLDYPIEADVAFGSSFIPYGYPSICFSLGSRHTFKTIPKGLKRQRINITIVSWLIYGFWGFDASKAQ